MTNHLSSLVVEKQDCQELDISDPGNLTANPSFSSKVRTT